MQRAADSSPLLLVAASLQSSLQRISALGGAKMKTLTQAQLRFEYRCWRAEVLERLRAEVEWKTSQRGWWLYRRFKRMLPQGW